MSSVAKRVDISVFAGHRQFFRHLPRRLRIATATIALGTDSKATRLGGERDFSTSLPPSPKTATADEPLRSK